MITNDILSIAAGGAGAGVGLATGAYLIRFILEWAAGRMDKREAAVDGATQRLISQLETRLDGALGRLDQVERDLRECRTKHAESEAKVLRLEAIIQGQGEIRQLAAGAVAADRLA